MREIQASEIAAKLPEILASVERGEAVRITRAGRPVARIVPDPVEAVDARQAAIARIKARQTRTGRITAEELIASKHEGHRP